MSDNKKNVDLNKVSYNFGTKGWTVIGFEIVMLFFMTGITVDGLNTIVPMMAEYHSWNPDVLLSISTPASIIASQCPDISCPLMTVWLLSLCHSQHQYLLCLIGKLL